MKLAHISDTHINRIKYHDEYRQIFEQIYETLREERPDYIVHTGDLFHSKLELTPECVNLGLEFLKSLVKIAPLRIIAGNHDANLKNKSRLNSITPLYEALKGEDIQFFENSGVYRENKNLEFKVFSIFDEEKWEKLNEIKQKSDIRIGLFHGSVAGVSTDVGYTLEHTDINVGFFEDCDYVLLGDIHKSNQILDTEGKVRYVGSTVQQNFGETDDKGILIWDIRSKDDFDCRHIAYPNPSPFITINLEQNGDLPKNLKVRDNAKIRVIANSNVEMSVIKHSIALLKAKFSPQSVTFINKAVLDSSNTIEFASNKENIRDLVVQEKYIKDYLKQFDAAEETTQKVVEMNTFYSKQAQESEEVQRYVNWKIKSLEWDNLFNYGEGNKIDFDNLSGIVGIFGPNYSGKSSVVDSLLYTAFNTTSKNNRKNINVINQNKDRAKAKLTLSIDRDQYVIERESKKYTKKLKGVVSTEAKTDVEFNSDSGLLNGIDRSDTDKLIRRYIGTYDDFALTSMSSQFGSLAFISEGSTRRKEILSKFLDLDTFDKKQKLAKEDSSELKALIKKQESFDYDAIIKAREAEALSLKKTLDEKKELLKSAVQIHEKLIQEVGQVEYELKNQNIPNFVNMTLEEARELREKNLVLSQKYSDQLETLNLKAKQVKELIDSIALETDNINLNDLTDEQTDLKTKTDKYTILLNNVDKVMSNLDTYNNKVKLLNVVPCGDSFPTCKFIKDAHDAKRLAEQEQNQLDNLKKEQLDGKVEYFSQRNRLNEIKELLDKQYQIRNKTSKLTSEYMSLVNEQMNAPRLGKKMAEEEIVFVDQIISYHNAQATVNELLNKKEELTDSLTNASSERSNLEKEINKIFADLGSKVEAVKQARANKKDYQSNLEKYNVYDLYLKCMHPNGIPYEIIKNNLPVINTEVQRILSNIVDFEVYLENDEDKLELMIKHPRYDPRPLEMGSGAEKTLASIAIRLALITITSLPKPDIFIMDEPGTALDESNLDGFIKILDLIKTQFKTVILISHLEALKECVDTQIQIEKVDGFAHINI
jgi:exonuclease SbcD